jgi:predicted thioredoxin/glutaredoxin
MYKRNAQ